MQAARRHAERGLELDPLDAFSHFNMGRSFWLTAEPEVAQGWLQRAVALNPNYAQGFYANAFTSMLTGNAEGPIRASTWPCNSALSILFFMGCMA